jgi:hypothetical protein
MATKYWVYRDKKARKNYSNTELNKLVLKSLLSNHSERAENKLY